MTREFLLGAGRGMAPARGLVFRIGSRSRDVSAESRKMRQPWCPAEPIRVSERFRLTLEATILALEAGAGRDERMVPLLEDAEHRRRQERLVAAQLERAYRLRKLLARTTIGPTRAA